MIGKVRLVQDCAVLLCEKYSYNPCNHTRLLRNYCNWKVGTFWKFSNLVLNCVTEHHQHAINLSVIMTLHRNELHNKGRCQKHPEGGCPDFGGDSPFWSKLGGKLFWNKIALYVTIHLFFTVILPFDQLSCNFKALYFYIKHLCVLY